MLTVEFCRPCFAPFPALPPFRAHRWTGKRKRGKREWGRDKRQSQRETKPEGAGERLRQRHTHTHTQRERERERERAVDTTLLGRLWTATAPSQYPPMESSLFPLLLPPLPLARRVPAAGAGVKRGRVRRPRSGGQRGAPRGYR